MEAEAALIAWFNGENDLHLQFYADESSLVLFCAYFKCLPVQVVPQVLNRLLTSQFVRTMHQPLRMQCEPKLQFFEIRAPNYMKEYEKLEKTHGLSKFIDACDMDLTLDMQEHGAGRPIFLSVMTLGWVKIVNFLPAL